MLILPTAYLPNLSYFAILLNEKEFKIESHEYFVKQTIRNRCAIATPQGELFLSIPLIQTGNKSITAVKKISYRENWQLKHWRAIESAYKKSPFFEYFESEFKEVFFAKPELLIEFNAMLLNLMFQFLRVENKIQFTEDYRITISKNDFRDESVIQSYYSNFPSYYQVFKEKTGFQSNLSIIDLFFNEGLASIHYLCNLRKTN